MDLCSTKQDSLGSKIYAYFSRRGYILPLLLSLAAAYLWFLMNPAIAVDSITGSHYNAAGMVAQKRFTGNIFSPFLTFFGSNSLMTKHYVGILLLGFSAVLFCVVFDHFDTKQDLLPRVVFSCLLVTAPIYTEAFPLKLTFQIGGGMTLTALADLLVIRSWEGKRFERLFAASILMMLCSAWYESICALYVISVFSILILKIVCSESPVSFKEIFLLGLSFLMPLLLGLGEKRLVLAWLNRGISSAKPAVNYADNTIRVPALNKSAEETQSAVEKFLHMLQHEFFLNGIWYPPIGIYVITKLTAFVLMIRSYVQKKNFWLVPLFLGMHLSNLILCFLKWGNPTYRTCFFFAYSTAFVFYFLLRGLPAGKMGFSFRTAAAVGCVGLICWQIVTSNIWFGMNIRRYEEERDFILEIAEKLRTDYDTSKPVAFFGKYIFSESYKDRQYLTLDTALFKKAELASRLTGVQLYNYPSLHGGTHFEAQSRSQVNGRSLINWALTAFGDPNTELILFLNYEGYDFRTCKPEQYKEAKGAAAEMPAYPAEGSITDAGDYLIVRF